MDTIDPRLIEIADCIYRLSVKAIITHDHKFLLVKEEDDEWWSFPGGGIDYGETINVALGRELEEELGVPANTLQVKNEIVYASIGAVLDGVPKANLFYEVSIPIDNIRPTQHVKESQWVTISEIRNLYLSPSIKDNDDLIELLDTLV